MRHVKSLLCAGLLLTSAPLHAGGEAPSGEAKSLPSYAGDMRRLRVLVEKAAPDALVEALPGGFVAVFLPDATAATQATDARYNLACTRAAYVYAPRRQTAVTRTDDGVGLAVIVHYNDRDALPARRAARLSARLLRLHRERIGHDAVFPRALETADVWLAPAPKDNPSLGGETRVNQVYLWDWGQARTSVESVRTLCHEWGHLTLPAARGYSAPENDAAGFLGERLYLKWLRDEYIQVERDASLNADKIFISHDDGTDRAGLDLYHRRQIEPLIMRFNEVGPDTARINGSDGAAMDLYCGAALSLDASFGSRMLGMALYGIDGTRAEDFLRAMQDVVGRSQGITVRLPAWVPLTQGRYTAIADGEGEVSVSGRPVNVRPGAYLPLPVRVSGWKKVTCPFGAVRSVTLKQTGPVADE